MERDTFNKKLFLHLLEGRVILIETEPILIYFMKNDCLYQYVKECANGGVVYFKKDYKLSKICSLFYDYYAQNKMTFLYMNIDSYRSLLFGVSETPIEVPYAVK